MCIYLQIIFILNFKMEQMFVILEASIYGHMHTVYVYIHVCAYIFFVVSPYLLTHTHTYIYVVYIKYTFLYYIKYTYIFYTVSPNKKCKSPNTRNCNDHLMRKILFPLRIIFMNHHFASWSVTVRGIRYLIFAFRPHKNTDQASCFFRWIFLRFIMVHLKISIVLKKKKRFLG